MNTQIIFVADLFAEDYEGGAELTTKALIDASSLTVRKVKAKDVNVKLIQDNQAAYWLFGNFASLDFNLIPTIVGNLNYSVLEYDYKFCNYRSVEKHKVATGHDCNCADQMIGKYVSAFYYGADHIFWMSEGQRDRYHKHFPHLVKRKQTVLSSVFEQEFFNVVDVMKNSKDERSGWLVLGSESWIKGREEAIEWCKKHNKQFEVVWNIPYADMLSKFAEAEGFVYLPRGGDTCPRMVIEAKLLGCDVVVNDNVQHSNEKWWQGSPDDVCDYLKGRPRVFWSIIEKYVRRDLSVSGCIVTQDSMSRNDLYIESIEMMVDNFDEIIVVDACSTDDTVIGLEEIAKDHNKVKIIKSDSRDLDYCWKLSRSNCQSDLIVHVMPDEIVDDNFRKNLKNVVSNMHKSFQVIALPLLTYTGGNKALDITRLPWKTSLTRNYPHINFSYNEDKIDVINVDLNEPMQFASFFTPEAENLYKNAQLSEIIREKYQAYLAQLENSLPTTRKYRL